VWERDASLDCPLCRKPIRCNDPVFSYSISEEHESEGVFDVDITEAALVTCRACSDRHELVRLLKLRSRELVRQLSHPRHRDGEMVALTSRYACKLCGQRIPDGERLFTAAFEFGHQGHHRLSIAELKIDLTACLICVARSAFRDSLHKMVAAVLVDCRRQSLRVIH
jgi:hypothetical protein